MTEIPPSELRWLAERVDRNHAETTGAIAELKAQVAGIPAAMDRYVPQRVYDADERRRAAERDADDRRFKRLEDTDTTQAAGRHSWVIGIGLALIGTACGVLSQLMTARGK